MSKRTILTVRDRALSSVMQLFAGGMAPAEEKRLNDQRRKSQEFEGDFVALTHALAAVETLRDDLEIQAQIDAALVSVSEAPEGHKPRSRFSRQWLGYACAATLLLSIFVVFQVNKGGPEPAHNPVLRYVTQVGEQKTLNLADGSVVTLNTGSQLLVDVSEGRRRMVLERGEAYFTVAKDPRRPFTVDIDGHSVTALGTEFNILRSADGFTLAVTEGVVGLHSSDEAVLPSATALNGTEGTQVDVSGQQQHRVVAGWVVDYQQHSGRIVGSMTSDLGQYQQWRTGMLRFSDQPLMNVVRELNRYSAKKILIEDKRVMDLPISAALRVHSIHSAIAALEQSYPIKVSHYFDRIVIVSAAP